MGDGTPDADVIPLEPGFDPEPELPLPEPTRAVEIDDCAQVAFTVDQLPSSWTEILDSCVACRSFVEAGAQVMRLEVGAYRDAADRSRNACPGA
ncbi:MAG: hypothetical protein QM811_01455 [Pirellulales bacterium]